LRSRARSVPGDGGGVWKARNPAMSAAMEPAAKRATEMRRPARVSGLGTVKDSVSMASSLSHAAINRMRGGIAGRT
jgi:hypothetical protein